MSTPIVCSAAVDLIIECEVSSQAAYTKLYSHPTWPGGSSGVTIGIGFDLGYEEADVFDQDWGALDETAREALGGVLGIKGDAAHAALPSVVHVVVPWDAAYSVFTKSTLPRYAARTVKAFPGSDGIPDLCFGALVSLVYNRGTSMTGDSRREMAAIRDLIQSGDLAAVPDQFRSMKRLWPTTAGLRDRRDKEASLWESGLSA